MKEQIKPGDAIKVLDHGYVRYLNHAGSDKFICDAARISYQSVAKSEEEDAKLLAYLWKNKHTSPFEMCKVYLNVKMPIFVMRQWVRHRMQNLNEVSARYTELPNEFYIPERWRAQDTKNRQGSVPTHWPNDVHLKLSQEVERHCDAAYRIYQSMLHGGVAREMARMVLPLNIYTEIVCCWDLKNLLHFITLREDAHAQAEIQEYGRAIKSILVELFPITMQVYEKYKFPCVETPKT